MRASQSTLRLAPGERELDKYFCIAVALIKVVDRKNTRRISDANLFVVTDGTMAGSVPTDCRSRRSFLAKASDHLQAFAKVPRRLPRSAHGLCRGLRVERQGRSELSNRPQLSRMTSRRSSRIKCPPVLKIFPRSPAGTTRRCQRVSS